jgi:hypothetical protein
MYAWMSSYNYIYNYTCDYSAHQYMFTCGSLKCDTWHHMDFSNILPNNFFPNHLIKASRLWHMAI